MVGKYHHGVRGGGLTRAWPVYRVAVLHGRSLAQSDMDEVYQGQVCVANDRDNHRQAYETASANPVNGIVGLDHVEKHRRENADVLLCRSVQLSYYVRDFGKEGVFRSCLVRESHCSAHDSGSSDESLAYLAHLNNYDARGPGSVGDRMSVYLHPRTASGAADPGGCRKVYSCHDYFGKTSTLTAG